MIIPIYTLIRLNRLESLLVAYKGIWESEHKKMKLIIEFIGLAILLVLVAGGVLVVSLASYTIIP